jgi:hypothetical protein
MKFPLVSRAHHERVVTALAKLLYPEGVPAEFQLLLGVEIPQQESATTPVHDVATSEPLPTEDDEAAEQRLENIRRLTSLRRTAPSKLGPELARIMQADAMRGAHRPAKQIFAAAKEQALKHA